MVYTFDEGLGVERLEEEIVGTSSDGIEYAIWRVIVREDNDAGGGALAANFLDEPFSVSIRQR